MTPIENRLDESLVRWADDYMACMRVIRGRHQRLGLSLVEYHKRKLGRQTRCFFNGEFRFWVWETGQYTLYCSNQKGVCFEVPEMSTIKSALAAWAGYKSQMGIRV